MPTSEHIDATAEQLFRSHAPFVARFLFRLGVAAADLDDVVQEVFLVVHKQGGYVRERASKTTYLASIAVRAASSSRRRTQTHRARHAELPSEGVESERPGPVEILEERESMRRLQSVLDGLDPELKTTLILVDLEGQTCSAVAAGMQIPIGTVYWRLHQARKLFREAADEKPRVQLRGLELTGRRTRNMGFLFFGGSTSAAELLEAGRRCPPTRYDVERAVLRHLDLVRSGAPWPRWAQAAAGAKTATAVVAIAACASVVAAGGLAALVLRDHPRPPPAQAVRGAVVAELLTSGAPSAVPGAAGEGVPTVVPEDLPRGVAPPAEEAAPEPRSADWGPRSRRHVVHARIEGAPAPGGPGAPQAASSPRTVVNQAPAPPAAQPPGVSSPAPPGLAAQAAAPNIPASTRATSSGSPEEGDETAEVGLARRVLASDPARALAIVRSCESRFPDGYMVVERRFIGISALFALGRKAEATAAAAAFLRDYPTGALSQRIRSAMTRDAATGN